MFRSVSQPLHASDNMSDTHFPIIDYISEMECGKSIILNNYEVIERSSSYFSMY